MAQAETGAREGEERWESRESGEIAGDAASLAALGAGRDAGTLPRELATESADATAVDRAGREPDQQRQRGARGERSMSLQTFRVLRHRDFSLLWGGLVISAVGTWMQIVAQSLLVLQLTHNSAFALGVVSLAQAASFFCFAFIGGAVADRVDKRRFLLVTQSISMLLAVLLGTLVATHTIQVWMIVALAFVSGANLSFDQPTRSALIPLLVPRDELLSAIALQSIVFQGAAVIGPALAAFTLQAYGFAANYFLNAISFLGVLVALALIHMPKHANEARESRGNLWGNVGEALGVVRRDAALPWLVASYGAMLFFGPSGSLILPIFATTVLHINKVGLGILFTMGGVGTVLGALFISSVGRALPKGALALGGVVVWSAAFLVFAFTTSFPLACLLLLISSGAQNIAAASTITLMQLRVPPRMRGRVMSLNTLLIMGARPLGDFPAGALIGPLGAPLVVALGTGVVGVYTLVVGMLRPKLRQTR